MATVDGALAGVRVLDFSTLLPGPLATAILAEAGAEVVKVERPGGDEMRTYLPRLGPASGNFALLNRGKRSVALDLKSPGAVERLGPLLEQADVLVEQFRPGVMERLGLGYDAVRGLNPAIVYCSVSGYRPDRPEAGIAGHDLNYVAGEGLLDLVADRDGNPVLPHALIADIGGGAYPAVMNIALALLQRERTGAGAHLQIAMAEGVRPFLYWAYATGTTTGEWPARGAELLTGGSPRYALYRTADGRHLAAAPLEERFWQAFCDVIELPPALRDDRVDPKDTIRAVAERVASRSAAEWERRFAGVDACCNLVRTVAEAQTARAEDDHGPRACTPDGAGSIPALPLPVAAPLRCSRAGADRSYPALGDAADLLDPREPTQP